MSRAPRVWGQAPSAEARHGAALVDGVNGGRAVEVTWWRPCGGGVSVVTNESCHGRSRGGRRGRFVQSGKKKNQLTHELWGIKSVILE